MSKKVRDIALLRNTQSIGNTNGSLGFRGAYDAGTVIQALVSDDELVADSHALLQLSMSSGPEALITSFGGTRVPANGFSQSNGDAITAPLFNSRARSSLAGFDIPIFSSIEVNHTTYFGAARTLAIKKIKGELTATDLKKMQNAESSWKSSEDGIETLKSNLASVSTSSGSGKALRIVTFRFGAGNSENNSLIRESISTGKNCNFARDKWRYPTHPSLTLTSAAGEVMSEISAEMQSAVLNVQSLLKLPIFRDAEVDTYTNVEVLSPGAGLPPLAFTVQIALDNDKSGQATRMVCQMLACQIDTFDVAEIEAYLRTTNKYQEWLNR